MDVRLCVVEAVCVVDAVVVFVAVAVADIEGEPVDVVD